MGSKYDGGNTGRSNTWKHYAVMFAGLLAGLLLSSTYLLSRTAAASRATASESRTAFRSISSVRAQVNALRAQRDVAYLQLQAANQELSDLRSQLHPTAPLQQQQPQKQQPQKQQPQPPKTANIDAAQLGSHLPGEYHPALTPAQLWHTPWGPSAERDAASTNPQLAVILREVPHLNNNNNEVVVAVSDLNLAQTNGPLQHWSRSMEAAGVKNRIIVALDATTQVQAEKWGTRAVMVNPDTTGNKFLILRQFLELGYSVLLSDVDVVTLSNPFHHLVRDCDIEGQSDGLNTTTAGGYEDAFDDTKMGASNRSHSIRVSAINSGLFYIRPTPASVSLLDTLRQRLGEEKGKSEQELFNEALFMPSHPGYAAPFVTLRILDPQLFTAHGLSGSKRYAVNSKIFFGTFRKDPIHFHQRSYIPSMIHINYHQDKLERVLAIEQYYFHGNARPVHHMTD